METRDGEAGVSQHFGAPLSQRGEYARRELAQLAGRHPGDEAVR